VNSANEIEKFLLKSPPTKVCKG